MHFQLYDGHKYETNSAAHIYDLLLEIADISEHFEMKSIENICRVSGFSSVPT